MSPSSLKQAERNVALRNATRGADDTKKEGWRRDPETDTVRYVYRLDLDQDELAALQNIAERYEYARELLDALEDDGALSEHAAWAARDALEDDTGQAWPSTLPMAGGPLARKIGALFDRVE